MGSASAEYVDLLAEIDELRLELAVASRRSATLLDEKPLFAALSGLCDSGVTTVEVVVVLRMIVRLRFALRVIEYALLDRSLEFHGLQQRVAATLGIGVPGVTNRRIRLPEVIKRGKAGKPNPRRPKPEEAAIRPSACAIVTRYEEEMERGLPRHLRSAVPDCEDYWGVLVHVWFAGAALPRETAAEDTVDGLQILVFLEHQLNRLEHRWLELGRKLRIPNSILGTPTGRRSRNAVWKAKRRLRNGTAPAGTFSLTGPVMPPRRTGPAPSAASPDLNDEVRVMVAALLLCVTLLDDDPELDSWLNDLATAFPESATVAAQFSCATLLDDDPGLGSWLNGLAAAFRGSGTADATEPPSESSVALLLFLVWDLWNSELREHHVLGPLLARGMELRGRVHAWRQEHAGTDLRS